MPRTVVIGDIHGMLAELRELLDAAKVWRGDRVVFLGDLIDKGPEGPEVVSFVRRAGYECVLGNHEEKALRWLKHEEVRLAKIAANPKQQAPANPMKPWGGSEDAWRVLSPEDVEWLRTLPMTIDLGGNMVAVHAGFLPRTPIAKQHKNDMCRMRWIDPVKNKMVSMDKSPDGIATPEGSRFWMELWDGQEGVVYGHVVHTLDAPRVDVRPGGPRTWCYGIDTGGVHGGKLTALVLRDETADPEIVQVDAKRTYVPFGIHGNGASSD